MAEKNKIIKVKDYPYNFVSLGENVINKGERVLGKNTGILKCKLRTYSPLFIMGERDVSENGHSEEYFLKENGNYIIPSSTLKGEIRTIIEVLTNSVIRNVETERLEKRLKPNKEQLVSYGIIKSLPKDGVDGIIKLAKKIKIKREILKNGLGEKFDENGKIMRIYMKKNIKKYKEITDEYEFKKLLCNKDNPEKTVVTIWSSSKRPKAIYEKILVETDEVLYKFSKNELDDLEYLIKQRSERDENDKKEKKDFYYKPKKDKNKDDFFKLKENDPIIIYKSNEKSPEYLAFSEIPRLRYKLAPLDLIPPKFRPSNSLKNLSFSEKLFGTTGNHNEKSESKELTSISGRVFFSDAKLKEDKAKFIKKDPITLKPFGEPHPTLLSFYLIKDGNYDDEKSRIRGRKFYWHHENKIEKRYESYSNSITMNSREAYNSSLQLLDYGNEFDFDVCFNNLTDEELGVLIYSLELEEGLLHKVGKGKAFGFGSSKITIVEALKENDNKYQKFSKNKIYDSKLDKEKYIEDSKKEYIDEKRKNIKELKAILSVKNGLNFEKSPFPEEKDKNGWNTLAWFTNRRNNKIILETISEIMNIK